MKVKVNVHVNAAAIYRILLKELQAHFMNLQLHHLS